MPPLTVTVKLDPDSMVKLEQPAMVTLDRPPVLPRGPVADAAKNDNNPAIQTSVTVFKTVKYGTGEIYTGWKFANGAAKEPYRQYCYFQQILPDGNVALQNVGRR